MGSTSDTTTTMPGPNPTISIHDASVVEGNSGNSRLRFTVSLSEVTNHQVLFHGAITNGGTASADDFVNPGYQAYAVNQGELETTIDIPVVGDTNPEPNETVLFLIGGGVEGGTVGTFRATGTIVNDDGNPDHTFTVSSPTVTEADRGTQKVRFAIDLDANAPKPVRLAFKTVDGTAVHGADFIARKSSVVVPKGKRHVEVTVTVKNDRAREGTEKFTLEASAPPGYYSAGPGIATIVDND